MQAIITSVSRIIKKKKKKESIIFRVILTVYVFLFPFGQQEHPAYCEVHQSAEKGK